MLRHKGPGVLWSPQGVPAQSCLILCDPTDCSPPGFCPWDFSRKEHWSGWPFPSPGPPPNSRIEPESLVSPCIGRRILDHWATWEAPNTTKQFQLYTLSCWLNCEPAALNRKLSFPLSSYQCLAEVLALSAGILPSIHMTPKSELENIPCGADGRRARWYCKKIIYNDPSMTHSLHSPRPYSTETQKLALYQ